ncbi:uncharacterized protein BP5553_10180 [Venustampulla echinocandica]|uniref:Heterokaryon incompatibility domain-containing protein n=1 Tax=Venustampulla echinocandica TaxID=2656787 RepID=A0A370TAK8_9HELO|nr:uncharacterized protein BP5553_10180 [Venustampulla echinocandica]RDL30835.1 hypothetical protein BP5553_10180 [Venustampulla echinocandica]
MYKYKPLNSARSFRLLALKPGKGDNALVCELHAFDFCHHPLLIALSNTPQFEAISYVWGSSPPVHEIQCDGEILRITENLRATLCAVRRSDRQIYVWADAICIDQSDLRERKMQVALMRDIYSRAERVSICLNTVGMEKRQVLGQTIKMYATSDRHQWSEQPLYDVSSSFWSLLAEFFDNPWFSRIWVVQEIAESKSARILFDGQEIPWEGIVCLVRRVLGDQDYAGRVLHFAKTNGIRNVLFMNNRETFSAYDPIPALLQATRAFRASDPRDKVFAMLEKPIKRTRTYAKFRFLQARKYAEFSVQSISLLCLLSATFESSPAESRFWCLLISLGFVAHFLRFDQLIRVIMWDICERLTNFCFTVDRLILHKYQISDTICSALSIAADYSLTTQSVYRMVATRLMERSGTLNILSYVHHGSAIDITFPSWVPQWDVATPGIHVLIALPRHQYQASAGVYHKWSLSDRSADHLQVQGLRFSTVSATSDIFTSERFPHGPRMNDGVFGRYDGAEDTYPTGISMATAWTATLTAGQLASAAKAKRGLAEPQLPRYHRSLAAAQRSSYGRRQFFTENGYMGLGPAAMREGDLVCVLFGGCIPYILRPTDTDNMYKFVGESYVHGIMNGEVINLWQQGKITKNRFTLC